ncbi:MAG: hypothetical protein KAV82_16680 [Phycisphaerae bacterium]|nr:hypothetical protein [Phycisphaerae bacterium]
MLVRGDHRLKPRFTCPAMLPLCVVVVAGAAYGPVAKVSLLEEARERLDKSTTLPGESPERDSEPTQRAPGTDPVLMVCTQSDWDRTATARPLPQVKHPLFRETGSLVCPELEGRGLVGAGDDFRRWHCPSVEINPNSRTHAPPSEFPCMSA